MIAKTIITVTFKVFFLLLFISHFILLNSCTSTIFLTEILKTLNSCTKAQVCRTWHYHLQ